MIPLISFGITLLLCLLLLSRHSPLKILDMPNERSLHKTPTPHTGGVAIILAIFTAWALQVCLYGMPESMVWISVSALLVAGISFVDDLRELSPLIRITVHALAAVVLLAGGLVMFDGWIGVLFTLGAIVWMLNLYNFMDGMDGFAGGMTLFGFGFLACTGLLQGANEYAMFALMVAAAALGFLCVNFPPAKIFMGDVGSATLGLLAAGFSLWGISDGLFSWWFPLLVFSPFVGDATVTLIRRVLNRERFWEAHRSHYYQRLVQMGWGHKKTVLAEYVVMLLAGCSALAAQQINLPVVTAIVLAGWSCIYLMIAVLVHRHESGGIE
jgi:UDP-N-acetylmuramyl pentapeptide phosphotransferase/UDP-N-acetylglucosamine-1-phosphate transferase